MKTTFAIVLAILIFSSNQSNSQTKPKPKPKPSEHMIDSAAAPEFEENADLIIAEVTHSKEQYRAALESLAKSEQDLNKANSHTKSDQRSEIRAQYVAKLEAMKDIMKCEKVIKKPTSMNLSLQGLDYFYKNNKIVGVAGLKLDAKALDMLTERYAMLDNLQFMVCQQTSAAWQQTPVNYSFITAMTDKYFSTFELVTKMAMQIKEASLKPNASEEIKKVLEKPVEIPKTEEEKKTTANTETVKKSTPDTITKKNKSVKVDINY